VSRANDGLRASLDPQANSHDVLNAIRFGALPVWNTHARRIRRLLEVNAPLIEEQPNTVD